jgi:hypothetical protein
MSRSRLQGISPCELAGIVRVLCSQAIRNELSLKFRVQDEEISCCDLPALPRRNHLREKDWLQGQGISGTAAAAHLPS